MKMNKYFLLILISLLTALGTLSAQTVTTDPNDAKKVTVTGLTAGGLKTALSGKDGLTSLTINGTMDDRDFKTIRDNYSNTLANLDLSGITKIAAYQGADGTSDGTVAYPENELPAYALGNWNNALNVLAGIKLPPSIISIGSNAFYKVNGSGVTLDLSSLTALTTLRKDAFQRIGFNTIILPNTATNWEHAVFENAFCINLTLPGNLTEIPDSTFIGAYKLGTLKIPAGVKKIGNYAFYGSSATITLPEGLEELGGVRTFAWNSSAMPNVTIPANASFKISGGIMEATFTRNTNITTMPYIPSNVTVIGGNTFNGTSIVGDVVIPEGVTQLGGTTIGDPLNETQVFNSAQLTSIKLPSTLTTIGAYALNGINFSTLEIPAKVSRIYESAIGYWKTRAIKTIIVHNPDPDVFDNEQYVFDGITKGNVAGACVLYVPAGAVDAYKTAYLWESFSPNIKAIGADAHDQTVAGLKDKYTAHLNVAAEKTITLPANTDQGFALTYSFVGTGNDKVASLNGNILTVVGEGTATITATQAGDNLNWNAFTKTITLTVVDYSYLKAAAIAVEGDSMLVVGPGAGAYTKLYINGTASTNGDLSKTNGTVNLKATDANATKILKLTITHQASTAASAASRKAAASSNAAGRAAAERSLRDAVNNSMNMSGK